MKKNLLILTLKKNQKSNELFQCFPKTSIPLPSEVEISESGTCN